MSVRETSVTRFLDNLNINYRTFTHPGKITSLEQAAIERHQEPGQVIRSILFRLPEDEFVMVLVGGSQQLSWKAIRQYLGSSRITMATDEEVVNITGYVPGAVSPFGINKTIRILADENIFSYDEVSIGSGIRGTTVILRSEEIKVAIPALEIGHFI